jgi:RNA polymerase sigma factor (sigma-70 family)
LLKKDIKELSDENLISMCIKGESHAWSALISRHKRLIYSISLKFGLDEDDRADVFQSVCLILLDKLGTVRRKGKLASWLSTVTRRECLRISRISSGSRAKSIRVSNREDQQIGETRTSSFDQEVVDLEQAHLLRLGIESLPAKCRRLLHLLFYEKEPKSYVRISRDLGIPVSSIGPTRRRCLEKLKEILTRMGFE